MTIHRLHTLPLLCAIVVAMALAACTPEGARTGVQAGSGVWVVKKAHYLSYGAWVHGGEETAQTSGSTSEDTTYELDDQGNVLSMTYESHDSSQGRVWLKKDFTRDENGFRLSKVEHGKIYSDDESEADSDISMTVKYERTFDDAGRPVRCEEEIEDDSSDEAAAGEGERRSFTEYTYDDEDRITSYLRESDGVGEDSVPYSYLEKTVFGERGLADTTFSGATAGEENLESAVKLDDSHGYRWEFDGSGRPVKTFVMIRGQEVSSGTYEYDENGNVRTIHVDAAEGKEFRHATTWTIEWAYVENPSRAARLKASLFLPEQVLLLTEPVL